MGRYTVFILACAAALASCTSSRNVASHSKAKLIWSDEFSYKGLPDSTKWGYEVGLVRNKEKQYYTNARIENAHVENGCLVIESLRESYEGSDYTSASINTLGKASFDGDFRIEVSAKLPQGKGIWPAIWMMGSNRPQVGWPRCGEMDIMEFVGNTPNTVWGTFHWYDSLSANKSNHSSKGDKLLFSDLHDRFHVYGLERKGNTISLFVDDNVYFTFTPPASALPQIFEKPMYLLINTAVGGSWGGAIDDNIFPQKFYVDYVRVYRLR